MITAPCVGVMGAAVTFGFQEILVLNDVISGRTPCSLCVQTRAMGGQVLLGVFYPMLATAAGANYYAYRQVKNFKNTLFNFYPLLLHFLLRLPFFFIFNAILVLL